MIVLTIRGLIIIIIIYLSFTASSSSKAREEFSEIERYKMCKDVWRKALGDQIEFLGNKPVGKTTTYELYSVGRRPEYVQAFQCSTVPPILLEVRDDEEVDTIRIILQRDDNDDDGDDDGGDDDDDDDDDDDGDGDGDQPEPPKFQDDMQYEIKYITEIREATRREVIAFKRKKKTPINDEEEFSADERFRMCKKAVKEVPSGRLIKFVELIAGETTYYSIRREDPETHKENDTLEVVRAFECPTIPEIHLQLENDGKTVSIIIKRVPPIREGIRSYKLKGVKSIKDVNDQNKVAYEVQSLLAPEDLEYGDERRRKMCIRAAKIIPNARGYLKWLEEDPGEEKFYAVTTQDKRTVIREVVSAFECPTDPRFYLETYIDRYFRRSVRVIIDENEFTFSADDD